MKLILGLWKSKSSYERKQHTEGNFDVDTGDIEFSQLKIKLKPSVRNPSQNFTRFWDGFVFLRKFVRNSWENSLFEYVIKISYDFGTDLGRNFM